jgi:HNH endonuclease
MQLADFEDRLERDPETGCLLWLGDKTSFGYGRIRRFSGKKWIQVTVHRLAWEEVYGVIPPGMFICHRCDVPACVNVEHLFMGTHADNMADMVRKGRSPRSCGERNGGGGKLTDEKVRLIREDGRVYREIAASHGVTVKTIGRVKRREHWRHLL